MLLRARIYPDYGGIFVDIYDRRVTGAVLEMNFRESACQVAPMKCNGESQPCVEYEYEPCQQAQCGDGVRERHTFSGMPHILITATGK
jgi:hypothetical protein